MQQRHRQLAAQYQLNSYNKLNYHLKKIEPFRNKPKRTVTEQMKLYNRNQKVSTIPTNKTVLKKPLIKHIEQSQEINEQHLNKNIMTAASQVKIYEKNKIETRKNLFQRGSSENRFQKISVAQRGKSLKYWKVQKAQPNFLTHIKGFFNTFLSESDGGGCNCTPTCQCKQILLKWIHVSNELIKSNYSRLLSIAYKKQPITNRQKFGETRMSNWSENYDDQFESKAERLQRVKHQIQIQKDVIRTQTQNKIFHQKQVQDKMQRILMCYTVEDPEVGYVQSMNIVTSGVLFHVRDEALTYAICRKLFHEIRKIYLNDFKQCYRHVDYIIKLLQQNVIDLYNHLEQHGVDLRVVIFPWILSLLCVIVPLQHLHMIYIGFVRKGWNYIYKIILALFVYHKQKIKDMDQCGDILVFLSSSNENQRQKIDWQDIAKFAEHLQEYF